MSRAAAKKRDDPVEEPDRLEGFSSPREVDRLFGHDAALAEFGEALHSGRLHHAWLLVGPEGVGKATLAYRLAREVLARGEEGAPQAPISADHPVFRKVVGLGHPNLLLIRRSWNDKTKRYSQYIGVDEVRRLRNFLGHSAGETGWRVVIVDRADDLNQNAANALLKALEEPPPRTLFLLVATAEGRIPVTIRSRCRTLRVTALGHEELEGAVRAAIERDEHEVDAETLSVALELSQGSVRRALELATGEGIALHHDILATFARLPELDGPAAHKLAERLGGFGSDSERLELFLSLLLGLMERLIRETATGEGAIGEERELAARLLSPATLPHWVEAWEAIGRAKADAASLNLDRSLLVLETLYRLQQAARGAPA
jgi:DNA polymerase III subunit delta'